MTPPVNTFIYLVYSEIGILVGRSTDVTRRFAIVDSNSPIELLLFRVYRIEKNRIHEKRLHKLFAIKNIRGGWFALDIKDIKTIDSYLIENKGTRILDNLDKINKGPTPINQDASQDPFRDLNKEIDGLEKVVGKLKGALDGRKKL